MAPERYKLMKINGIKWNLKKGELLILSLSYSLTGVEWVDQHIDGRGR